MIIFAEQNTGTKQTTMTKCVKSAHYRAPYSAAIDAPTKGATVTKSERQRIDEWLVKRGVINFSAWPKRRAKK